uniref:Uncharacterized protein n=1 Tax=Arundo donax TaxID=35708 RepID=A0A0A9E0Q2_ARUDO
MVVIISTNFSHKEKGFGHYITVFRL